MSVTFQDTAEPLSFTWTGNQHFDLPIASAAVSILFVAIEQDHQNVGVEIAFSDHNYPSPGRPHGITVDWLEFLTFAPNGRWVESLTAFNGHDPAAQFNSNHGFIKAFEGHGGVRTFSPEHAPSVAVMLGENSSVNLQHDGDMLWSA